MGADVAIVGAGHNGLVAAAYLAKAGLDVHLFERRALAGGAAATEELWPGFKFSTCAQIVSDFHPRIIRDLDLYDRGLEFLPRTGSLLPCRDGTYFGPRDHDSPKNRSLRFTTAEREGQRRYNEFKRRLSGIFAPYRLQPPPTLGEVREEVAGTAAAGVLEKALTTRIYELQDEFLPTDILKDRFAFERVQAGRNPLALTLAYASFKEVDEETGQKPYSGYVKGGTGAMSRAIANAAEAAGAQVHLNREVRQFLVENDRVIGVKLEDGSEERAPVVVSNLDPKRTFLKLLPPEHLPEDFRGRIEGLITGISSYKLLAVVSQLPRWKDWDGDPELPSRGGVVLEWTRASAAAVYDDLEAGRPPARPAVSVSIPSVVDPGLTQTGYHTLTAWIYPAPSKLREGTWDRVRARVAENLVDQITEYAPNFKGSIRHLRLRTPLDLVRENGLTDGCIWHVQNTAEHFSWNRPLPELADYRAPLKGLYLCGAGQHPGGNVCGMPGYNAAQEILKDL